MNSKNCKRTLQNPLGDTGYPPVQTGNLLAARSALLFAVGASRSVAFFLEQPASSKAFTLPWFKCFLDNPDVFVGIQQIKWTGPLKQIAGAHQITSGHIHS